MIHQFEFWACTSVKQFKFAASTLASHVSCCASSSLELIYQKVQICCIFLLLSVVAVLCVNLSRTLYLNSYGRSLKAFNPKKTNRVRHIHLKPWSSFSSIFGRVEGCRASTSFRFTPHMIVRQKQYSYAILCLLIHIFSQEEGGEVFLFF